MRAQRRDEKFVVPLEQGHGRNATEPLVGEIVMLGCDGVPADFFVRCFLYRAATGFGEQLSAQTVTDDGNAERHGFVNQFNSFEQMWVFVGVVHAHAAAHDAKTAVVNNGKR